MDCSPLTIASASRPFPGETVNGDAWVMHRYDTVFRLTVIDGLGHGPDAAAAAQAALDCLDRIVDPEPAVAIEACHQALRSTRGAVMLIVRIDTAANRLRFAGVGNVEARLQLVDGEHRLVSYRGIVGVVLPTIRTFEYSLTPQWRLLAHTDGIRGRFDLATEIDGETIGPEWAQRFLERWARPTDDATVVVVAAQDTQG
jgi:serine phosphatase RsbU (regulator of sigma subunit)